MIILVKSCLKFLFIPTGLTTDRMTLKFLTNTILLLKVEQFVGILHRIKIDGMVNDHSNSCNL